MNPSTPPSRPAPAGPVSFGPITFVPGRKGGRYPYCHSLVVDQGAEVWVVDPAADKDYFGELARTRRVTGVFLSHFHEDHQKYNHLFPHATFYGPLLEEEAFSSLDAVFRFMGITDPDFKEYWRARLSSRFPKVKKWRRLWTPVMRSTVVKRCASRDSRRERSKFSTRVCSSS
jgi:glyoxylase-like metal-dependent hydrolase (beta-lactamase superfamily II)